MESADFLSFVVTRFPSTRPHGISRTSFLVYSRNLRSWATSIFLDFSALGHLIHPIRLIIAFLFVEPRFRYPFLSPLPHDSQAWESLTGSPIASALCKRPITRYLFSEHNFLYNKNIKEGMEENKMSKQIVPLDVDYSSKKEGKSNAIILKLRKGKMEWVLYDSLDKEQLKLILELVMHHVNTIK